MIKKVASSKYKGVSRVNTKTKPWLMRFNVSGLSCVKRYHTEREAALQYDIKMIELGREPVNILKKNETITP